MKRSRSSTTLMTSRIFFHRDIGRVEEEAGPGAPTAAGSVGSLRDICVCSPHRPRGLQPCSRRVVRYHTGWSWLKARALFTRRQGRTLERITGPIPGAWSRPKCGEASNEEAGVEEVEGRLRRASASRDVATKRRRGPLG